MNINKYLQKNKTNIIKIFIIITFIIITIIIYYKYYYNIDNFYTNNKKYYLSIGCVFKNESHGLYEFIEHNLYHGVDHIYLINDFSNDNFMDILNPYINKGQVTLFNNDIINNNDFSTSMVRQPTIYNKYFKNILSDTVWIAIIDIDEYLYSPKEIDIKNIIKKYENDYDNIKVEWKTFGSNHCNFQPFSIVSAFNKHCNLTNIHENGNINKDIYSWKSIMKSDNIIKIDVHTSELNSNRSINLSYTTDVNELFINHYQLQSREFYTVIKASRGDVNNYIALTDRNTKLFEDTDKRANEIEDNILIEQNREIIKKVKNNKLLDLKDDKSVTVIITSCNRPLLLEKTFDSFIKYNTYPIKEYIIIDDSGIIGVNDFLITKYPNYKINLLYNKTNIGQVKSIDIAYEYITTKYIFHCEEDWEFFNSGFIEISFDILDNDPKIYTIWLRPHNETGGHPIDFSVKYKNYYKMSPDFKTVSTNKIDENIWAGITFNPGLRRTSDMLLFHPYTINLKPEKGLNFITEYALNDVYRLLGYYGAITNNESGYCKHIGYDNHIKRHDEL